MSQNIVTVDELNSRSSHSSRSKSHEVLLQLRISVATPKAFTEDVNWRHPMDQHCRFEVTKGTSPSAITQKLKRITGA